MSPEDLAVFTDRQLVALFSSGEESAFDELFRRHHDRVFRVALRMLGARADAEEALQEVFLRVARAADSWKPTAKFTTWLYRVTVNRCLSLRERRGVTHLVLLPDVHRVEDVQAGPFERAREEELKAAVRRQVADLPGSLAAAFTLCVLEGRSGPEAAEILEVPLGTIKTHVRRARMALRVKLSRVVGEEGSFAP